jgi:lipopolysaccharide biosynthesis glycosyltransferase
MSTLHVACAAEGSYDAHSAAMLHSVVANAGGLRVEVHYLHGPEFPSRSVSLIAGMLDAAGAHGTFHEIGHERVAGLPVVDEFTVAMWYRIFLPELAPDADRVLYLDADTLAVDDLSPLAEIDLGGYYLGAVTNVLMPHHLHRPESLGLAGPEVYFNSGVLLMNLEEMRRGECTRALHEYASGHPELEWPDQDALNVVLGSRRLALHPRWNAMNSLRFDCARDVFAPDELDEARRQPAIRHFEGPGDNKPWHRGCRRAERALYDRHRRETPWPRVVREGPRLHRARRLAGRAATRARRRLGALRVSA